MDKKETSDAVEKEFAEMEAILNASHPGVLDVERAYGRYEAAVRQLESYFLAVDPTPQFSTTDNSTTNNTKP